jgi:hypothetical protein
MARPRSHVALAVVVVGAVGRWLGGPGRLAFLTTSVLVDADHLVDYALFRRAGRRRWVVLPAHAWELVPLLLLCGAWRPLRAVGPAAALGLFVHLLTDQVTNRPTEPALYSLLFRLRHRFAADRLGSDRDAGGWMRRGWWSWL